MPLKSGPNSVRYNVKELMQNRVISPSRKKAILTIATRNNISRKEAKFKQALAIAKSRASK